MTSYDAGNAPGPVGVVGVGSMGGLVARRLLACGVQTTVYDLRADAVEAMVAAGARAAESAREVAERSAVVLTVVPSGADVEAVYAGGDGVMAGAHDGLVCVEMSTTAPAAARRIADLVGARGIDLIVAAIGGSARLSAVDQAAQGQILLMVGGSETVLDRARPVLDVLASRIAHCGSVEDAVSMKILNNLLAGLNLACSLEVLALGRKCGLEVETMMDVFTRTAADNARLHVMIPDNVLPRDFRPGLSMRLSRKDSDLALELARDADVPLVFGARLHELRTAALNRGLAELDQSALVQVFEENAGVELS